MNFSVDPRINHIWSHSKRAAWSAYELFSWPADNHIRSHSMWVSWSAYELFSRVLYIILHQFLKKSLSIFRDSLNEMFFLFFFWLNTSLCKCSCLHTHQTKLLATFPRFLNWKFILVWNFEDAVDIQSRKTALRNKIGALQVRQPTENSVE